MNYLLDVLCGTRHPGVSRIKRAKNIRKGFGKKEMRFTLPSLFAICFHSIVKRCHWLIYYTYVFPIWRQCNRYLIYMILLLFDTHITTSFNESRWHGVINLQNVNLCDEWMNSLALFWFTHIIWRRIRAVKFLQCVSKKGYPLKSSSSGTCSNLNALRWSFTLTLFYAAKLWQLF